MSTIDWISIGLSVASVAVSIFFLADTRRIYKKVKRNDEP